MEIQLLDIRQVRPYHRNPRKNDKAVEAVKQSIRDYGFNSPIVVDKKHVIIAGHTRYKALLEMKFEKVPCVVLDIDEKKAKEYRIADNKTSELSDWDMDNLIPELREIGSLEDMQIYFASVDVEDLIKESIGSMNFADITQEDVDKKSDSMATAYDTPTAQPETRMQVICPHCGEEFEIKR